MFQRQFKISIKAVLAGILVELVLDFLIILTILFIGYYISNIFDLNVLIEGFEEMSPAELDEAIEAIIYNNLFVMMGSLMVEGGTTFVGCFTAASIASNYKIAHSAVVGVISIILGILFLHFMNLSVPAWYVFTGWIITILVVLLGGYAAKG